ncbi:Inositol 2-dehydrogenase/D-chiro-inositol 3-dehydrogenase [Aquisphaera giovannonii]|uniref:Inositol 2-dehydrogenase/D-chiro-inositol 3-dehydrogenase n=1 Tax=Aquisphaera giovannonii TaxID=406548 RepID=A0A5B9W3J9_9BACT|nr:Gfo/Idh/MocA family oxidoreductase [Aquisphaera giovannonii]QEH35162.1 Inositol 2-dehydrogenase/D-chiro-inositol 3-dehydrogenase [Aquisphaera giovannonii]
MRPPSSSDLSRRDFVKGAAAASTAALAPANAHAAGGDEIKLALVGCGGRGTGAAADALGNRTHSNVRLVALADAFEGPVERALNDLKGQFHDKVDVPPDRRFVGLDAYEKAISAGADVVMLCTPPGFRPAHLAAAVAARKNVFLEKPVAVDAPGYRAVKAAGEEAKRRGLSIAVGHHLRHAKNHKEVVARIHDGLIGDLMFTRAFFRTQGIWNRPRQPGMTEMQYQVNNWYHFVWLSGDHNVEQHVHGIDACNWIARGVPVQATGLGGRQVRAEPGIGEIYDHHCVQYAYGDGTFSFSECSQIAGTYSNFSHQAYGTKGYVNFDGNDLVTIREKGKPARTLKPGRDGHQVEWDDFLAAIVAGRRYDELDGAADSTMTAILGRMATYSGQLVTWDEAVKSDLSYAPDRIAWDAPPRTKPGPDGIYPCAMPGITKAF